MEMKLVGVVFLLVVAMLGSKSDAIRDTGHPLKGILMVVTSGVRGDWCQWEGEDCDWSKTCCEGYCTAWTSGYCTCVGAGGTCGIQHGCCPNYQCDGYISGTCISR